MQNWLITVLEILGVLRPCINLALGWEQASSNSHLSYISPLLALPRDQDTILKSLTRSQKQGCLDDNTQEIYQFALLSAAIIFSNLVTEDMFYSEPLTQPKQPLAKSHFNQL